MTQPDNVKLPCPFRFQNGQAVHSMEDWHRRRDEILGLTVDLEYGGMPPTPKSTVGEELHWLGPTELKAVAEITAQIEIVVVDHATVRYGSWLHIGGPVFATFFQESIDYRLAGTSCQQVTSRCRDLE